MESNPRNVSSRLPLIPPLPPLFTYDVDGKPEPTDAYIDYLDSLMEGEFHLWSQAHPMASDAEAIRARRTALKIIVRAALEDFSFSGGKGVISV